MDSVLSSSGLERFDGLRQLVVRHLELLVLSTEDAHLFDELVIALMYLM